MKITYPAGSIECIVSGEAKGSFALWCSHVTYMFTKLDTSTNPTTVLCNTLGVGPTPSRFATPVKGTIVYDLDGLEPSDSSRPHCLAFNSLMKGVDVDIVWEMSLEMFWRAFNEDERKALRYRRSSEELEGLIGR